MIDACFSVVGFLGAREPDNYYDLCKTMIALCDKMEEIGNKDFEWLGVKKNIERVMQDEGKAETE